MKVTEPAGTPPEALTVAVNFTHESRVIDADDETSVVVVVEACADRAAADAAAGAIRDAVASVLETANNIRLVRRMAATSSIRGANGKNGIIPVNLSRGHRTAGSPRLP